MKIGIITFNSAHNYGAVLQAWATQTYLEKQGHQAEIINLRLNVIDNVYKMAVNKKYSGNRYVNAAINRARVMKRCVFQKEKYKRYRVFEKFIHEKLHVTKVYKTNNELREDSSLDYDVLIAGSDQIWNSSLTKVLSRAYFLDFGKKEAIRISYAASIGRKELPFYEKEWVRHFLQDIDYISVREVNAYKAIAPLTEKPVEIVADPTFLLEREDFDKLKQSFPVKGSYIYVHNVHLAKQDLRLFEMAEELSKRTGLPIVSNREDEAYSNVAGRFSSGKVEQFLGVISEAEYVVTNSFHATVFALIYHRKFITIPHITNPDRMQNLLRELGIEDHLMVSRGELPKDLSRLEIDYKKVEAKKKEMGKSSIAFLEKAIHGPKVPGKETKLYGVPVAKGPEHKTEGWELYLAAPKRKHVYQEQILCDALTPLAENVIGRQGVCALPVAEGVELAYKVINDPRMMEKAVIPEMFEADMGKVHEEVKEYLEKETLVLFVGSACRILSLRNYLNKEYENLLAVEIVGRGVCHREIYDGYVRHLEELYRSKLQRLELNNTFRHPEEEFTVANFESGAVKVDSNIREPLNWAYRRGYIQKLPCYFCKVKGGALGCADLTLGSWNAYENIEDNFRYMDFYKGRACAVLGIATGKGGKFWHEISGEFEVLKLQPEDGKIKELGITQKRLEGLEMLLESTDMYDGLQQLKKPKKKR